MNIIETDFPDVYIIEPNVFRDERGYFFETFNSKSLQEVIGSFGVVQSNQSKSKCGVIRGLHYQKPPFTQAKLVQVIKGEVLDVIVDIRTDSPTFGQYLSVILNGTNKKQLFVPKGFAHGFITLSKDAIFQYYVDNEYAPNFDSGVVFDDKHLNINWEKSRKIINQKDRKLKTFDENIFYTKAEYNYNPILL